MLFSRSEFDQRFKANQLRLAFIGMSNIGKSYRCEELNKEKNFACAKIDKKICQALGFEDSEEDLAKCLGFPYDERFKKNQKKY